MQTKKIINVLLMYIHIHKFPRELWPFIMVIFCRMLIIPCVALTDAKTHYILEVSMYMYLTSMYSKFIVNMYSISVS